MHISATVLLILGWILFGGIVGLIARAILPGRQSMGGVATIVLGVVGSFVGGMLGNALFGGGRLFVIDSAGWIGSILGALLLLVVVSMARSGRFAR